jgi:hypothetical protein
VPAPSRKRPRSCAAYPQHPIGGLEDDYRRGDDETRHFQRVQKERMKGLEPSTFCMARTEGEVTGKVTPRKTGFVAL